MQQIHKQEEKKFQIFFVANGLMQGPWMKFGSFMYFLIVGRFSNRCMNAVRFEYGCKKSASALVYQMRVSYSQKSANVISHPVIQLLSPR